MAILDIGEGVAIATKEMWEAWGKPTIRKTQMKLQLADRHLELPRRLLEDVKIPHVISNSYTLLQL